MARKQTSVFARLRELQSAARNDGHTKFDPGIPCKNGHMAPRWTANMCCAQCMSERRPYHKQPSPEKRREAQRRADAKRAGTEKRKAARRDWEKRRRDEIKAYKEEWRRAHPERWKQTRNARAKRWRDRHPEAVCALAARRRAKLRKAPAGDTVARLSYDRAVRKMKSVPCYWCGIKTKVGKRHVDHIIPLAAGGSDAVANLCVACPDCNQRKSAKLPEDFAGQSEMRFT
jgi:5-methylcytosine-specific restriction endonuclease McrA